MSAPDRVLAQSVSQTIDWDFDTVFLVPQRENMQWVSRTSKEGKLPCCCQGSEVSIGSVVGNCKYSKGTGMSTGSSQGPPNEFE